MLDKPIFDAKRESLLHALKVAAGLLLLGLLVVGISFFIFWQLMERDREAAEQAHLASLELARAKTEAQRRAGIASAGGEQDPPQAPSAEAALARFGLDYGHTISELGRPPQGWPEMKRRLEPGEEASPSGPDEAERKKTLEIDWSFDLRKLAGEQQATTLLAWERDPDMQGNRWCLFADLHTLRQLAKDEFAQHRTGKQ